MQLIVKHTGQLNGEIIAPGSKSHTVRGLIIAALVCGKSVLHSALDCDDVNAAISACASLGAKISEKKNCHGCCLIVESLGVPFAINTKKIFTGNSGITTNFIIPMLGLRKNAQTPVVADCGVQMKSRPIKPIIDAVKNLGMRAKFLRKENALPVEFLGVLRGGNTKVDGSISQYISGLLLNCPCADGNFQLIVEDLQERPYVEMTLNWLKEQGIQFKHFKKGNHDTFIIKGNQRYKPFNKIIPGDFSSASYFLAAGVLAGGKVVINSLDMSDAQGDKRLIEILKRMGAKIEIKKTRLGTKIICHGGKQLKGIKIDCRDIPDLLPTLAVIGTQASGKTELINIRHARLKETDRVKSMTRELRKMGAKIEEKFSGIVIHKSRLYGSKLYGCNDHRTVMALAVAGMLADGQTEIDTAQAINKTFPNYVTFMRKIGARMSIIHNS